MNWKQQEISRNVHQIKSHYTDQSLMYFVEPRRKWTKPENQQENVDKEELLISAIFDLQVF